MKISMEEKKIEALARMKLIKLYPLIIKELEKENILYYSEVMGILYWVENNHEWVELVQKFESKYKALVYHCELSHLEFGDCLSLFYVRDHKEEWAQDKANLRNCIAFVMVINLDDDLNYCQVIGLN